MLDWAPDPERLDQFPEMSGCYAELEFLRMKNVRLEKQNHDLARDVTELRVQLDKTACLSSELEERFSKHNQNIRELEAVKLERDDLAQRLAICARANSELGSHISAPVILPARLPKVGMRKPLAPRNENIGNISESNAPLVYDGEQMHVLLRVLSNFAGCDLRSARDAERFFTSTDGNYPKLLSAVRDGHGKDRAKEKAMNEELTREREKSQLSRNEVETLKRKVAKLKDEKRSSIGRANDIALVETTEQVSLNLDNENEALKSERDKLTNLVERQNSLSQALEAKLKIAEDRIHKLTDDLATARGKLRKATGYENDVPNVPATTWKCPEFPEELGRMIDGIAANQGLGMATKIRRALTTVTNWFRDRQEILEKQSEQDKLALAVLQKQTEGFLEYVSGVFPGGVDVRRAMTDESVRNELGRELKEVQHQFVEAKEEMHEMQETIDSMQSVHEAENIEIVRKVKDLTSENQELKQKTEQQTSDYEDLVGIMKGKVGVMEAKINDLTKCLETERVAASEQIANMKRNVDVLQKENVRITNEYAKERDELVDSHRQELKTKIGKLSASIDMKMSSIKQRHGKKMVEKANELSELRLSGIVEVERLRKDYTTEMDNLRKRHYEELENIRKSHTNALENERKTLTDEVEKLRKAHADEIERSRTAHIEDVANVRNACATETERLRTTCAAAVDAKSAALIEIERFKNAIVRLQHHKKRASTKVAAMSEQQHDLEASLTAKFKAEKSSLQARIADLVDRLRTQTIAAERTAMDLNSRIESVESEKEALCSRLTSANLQIQTSVTRASNAVAECEREKKSIESMLNAKVASIESDFKSRTELSKASQIEWKRRIYSTILNIFAKYVEGVRCIDDTNFESVLVSIRRKVETFAVANACVRNSLGIGPCESIEEAISSFRSGWHVKKRRR